MFKLYLIDIQPHSDHRTLNPASLDGIFNQHTSQFLVSEKKIVRPFYFQVVTQKWLKKFVYSNRNSDIEVELLGSCEKIRSQNKRQGKVFACLCQPLITPLPTSGGLIVSYDNCAFQALAKTQQISRFVVSGLTSWQINQIFANKKSFGLNFVPYFLILGMQFKTYE